MRRILLTIITTLVLLAGLGAAVAVTGSAQGGGSTVTRARLERSLPVVFSNVYAQEARLAGRTDVDPAALQAQAMCDKHGASGADVGPGGDWVCLMSWKDPEVPMPPEGYGKFELNVHSNDCYTAGSPSKLVGFLTMTDQRGREVTNPAFEFDGCFDPQGDNSPTGVFFPSLLAISSTTVTVSSDGSAGVQVTCGTGHEGCAGSIAISDGKTDLGQVPFQLVEESTKTLALPEAVPTDAKELTFTVTTEKGFGPTSPIVLPVDRR